MKRLLWIVAAAIVVVNAGAASGLELLTPRGGTVLEGGREATVVWSAASLPVDVQEWEAFLSLDGGAYYSVRITPHLDSGIRSFGWHVPNVATANARILIRVGNERDERAIEFPQTFTIVPRIPTSFDLAALDVARTETKGERALPAAPPVIEWVSGDRSGAHLATHRQRDRAGIDREDVLRDETIVAAHDSCPSLERPHAGDPATLRIRPAVARISGFPRSRRLLLLMTRLNI